MRPTQLEIVPRLIRTLIRKSQAPCKIYPIFSGWQKHLRFSRVATLEKAGFHKVNQKKMGAML